MINYFALDKLVTMAARAGLLVTITVREGNSARRPEATERQGGASVREAVQALMAWQRDKNSRCHDGLVG